MKTNILALILLASGSAFGASPTSQLICHDQYTEEASTTKLTATIVDSHNLADVLITTDFKQGPNQFAGLVLKSKGWSLSPYNVNGFEVFLTGEHVSAMEAAVPEDATMVKDFTVVFTIGSKWDQEPSIPSDLLARLDYNCDECGGAVTMEPNLYCSIVTK